MKETAPPEACVASIHQRYVREVVEDLNICPYARRAGHEKRVSRLIYRFASHARWSATTCAAHIGDELARNSEIQVLLCVLVVPRDHRWADPDAFDRFVKAVQRTYAEDPARRPMYMVGFHPRLRADPSRAANPSSFVLDLRRSPDPTIQCIDASMMDDLRRHARRSAETRILELAARSAPDVAALLRHAVLSDSELSAAIAQQNFASHGTGQGRQELELRLADIFRERNELYSDYPDYVWPELWPGKIP